jgi:nickel-type superoxide dismutase maturation protease
MTMPPIKNADFKEMLFWLCGRRKRFKVEGHSMLPLFNPGDQVLTKKYKTYAIEDVVICRHPFDKNKKLLKKIIQIDKTGRLKVQGINTSDSLDSRQLGLIQSKLVIGKVISIL